MAPITVICYILLFSSIVYGSLRQLCSDDSECNAAEHKTCLKSPTCSKGYCGCSSLLGYSALEDYKNDVLTCVAEVKVGESCDNVHRCPQYSLCDEGVCQCEEGLVPHTDDGWCVHPDPRALGASCERDVECEGYALNYIEAQAANRYNKVMLWNWLPTHCSGTTNTCECRRIGNNMFTRSGGRCIWIEDTTEDYPCFINDNCPTTTKSWEFGSRMIHCIANHTRCGCDPKDHEVITVKTMFYGNMETCSHKDAKTNLPPGSSCDRFCVFCDPVKRDLCQRGSHCNHCPGVTRSDICVEEVPGLFKQNV